jgi:hypothetical protein
MTLDQNLAKSGAMQKVLWRLIAIFDEKRHPRLDAGHECGTLLTGIIGTSPLRVREHRHLVAAHLGTRNFLQ